MMDISGVIANRFEIGEYISQGGMGTVYRGLDRQTSQAVAIKHLKPDVIADDPDLITRFEREGEILRSLNHPNIVKMLAMAHTDGQHYLIMEYVGGVSLAELLHPQPQLSIRRALDIALDLSDALTRTHRLNILHRDLKPANVLVAEDGTPRLTDFGVARQGKSELTGVDRLVGTAAYLSPQALNGETLDERADSWAFGIMLFEMLAGRRPFEGDTFVSQMKGILTDPIPDLETLRPDLPVALVDLVYRMLEKDRQQRISSVRLVGAELEAILNGTSPSSGTGRVVLRGAVTDEGASPVTPTPTTERPLHNFPVQPTPFVGREEELASLARLLADEDLQLITILGPGGMDFPEWEPPEDAAAYSAVRLFLQSAHRMQPDFALSADNISYVARICRLVQGVPLGIVLAAAWIGMLELSEIASEIERSLDFLESDLRDLPERQRSLRAVFEYSWNLMSEHERDVFMRLSVFRGGFTREAAQEVSGASLKTLMTLVNKSLLRRDPSGRYDVHELLRQYAEARLHGNAAAEADTRNRHSTFYTTLLALQNPHTVELNKVGLGIIESEIDNVWVALDWAIAQKTKR